VKLTGDVALVTGSARGIGRSIAEAFAREGASVVISDRDAEAAEKAKDAILAAGGHAVCHRADVSDALDIEALFGFCDGAFGRLDILVNNAGIGTTRLFLDTPLDEWERTLRVNLTGTFLCSQAASRVMVRQGSGRIINIASLSGQRGGTGRAAYGASKAGVELLTKVMSVELAGHGISVNAIAPGPIDTDTAKAMHTKATREAYRRLIPQRRYGQEEDVAQAAVFLACRSARYICGHTLNVDGGFLSAGLMFDVDQNELKAIRQVPRT
jgi:NAD(P)-dependent dehydrogenase (short-subunit alcohol dehydrogenase family)